MVLPSALTDGPFTVREARAAGLRTHELRAANLHRPTRGVRATVAPRTLHQRAVAFAAGMPEDAAYSHVTAARLWCLPLPSDLEGNVDLDVIRSSSMVRIRRRGCRGHRGLERRAVVVLDGLRVVGVADTWVDLGELVSRGLGVDDLVVAGDAAARRIEMTARAEAVKAPVGAGPTPRGGVEVLRDALDARVSPRGKVLLDQALPLVRAGSRSPMETRSRLMFVRAGFPEPELNDDVYDAYGQWLLEGDLVWHEQRVIGEYQGVDHASRRRRSADSSRATGAELADHRVLEIYAEDVFGGARRRACLTRFARALSLDPATLHIA